MLRLGRRRFRRRFMSEQRHIIKRQIIELQVQDQAKAKPLQTEAGRVYRQRVVPLIDKYCTELSEPDHIHRIESLAVDLGTIDPQHFEAELVAKLSTTLRESLAKQISGQERDAGRRGQSLTATSQLELLDFFARTGSLPWWADLLQPLLLNDILQGLIRDAPVPLACLMRELVREPRPLKRLVVHYDEEVLLELCRLLAPYLEASLDQFPRELTTLLQKSRPVAGRTQAQLRQIVWLGILRTAGLDGWQHREPSAFWREVLLQIALALGVTYAFLVSGIHRRIQAKKTGVSAQLRNIAEILFQDLQCEDAEPKELVRILEHLQRSGGPLARLSAVLRPIVNHLPEALRTELLAALKPLRDQESEREITKGVMQTLGRAIKQGVLPSTVVGQLLAELQKRQASVLPTDVLAQLTETLQEAIQKDETLVDLSFSESDDLYVDNSGLVILWPFLERFFERLDLLAERRLKNITAVQRAVGLLQMLVIEMPAPPEYLLPLNKVLCGMEPTEVFDFGPPVTPAEAEECTNLLTMVVERAPILKNMSLSGFRGTFLLRKGVLCTRDGAWLLRVERETYDVVLDHFPWGWEWVKLPWMTAPLRVEW